MTPPRDLRLVFDLDGTLIDSVRDLTASASELVTSLHGRSLTQEEVALMVGDGARELVRRALGAAGLDPDLPGALDRFLDIYEGRLLETTVPYAGVPDMLTMASRRGPLAVLTNKPLKHSRRILDALSLTSFFDDIVGGDGPLGRKPDPAGLHALASGGKHVMLVGDSPIDYRTTVNAGCAFAWARYGFSAPRFATPPDTPYVLDQPADLAEALDRFCALASGV